jgi:hypothetical protein
MRHVIAQGVDRFRIVEFLEGGAYLAARIEVVRSADEVTPEIEARAIQLRGRAARIALGLASAAKLDPPWRKQVPPDSSESLS